MSLTNTWPVDQEGTILALQPVGMSSAVTTGNVPEINIKNIDNFIFQRAERL